MKGGARKKPKFDDDNNGCKFDVGRSSEKACAAQRWNWKVEMIQNNYWLRMTWNPAGSEALAAGSEALPANRYTIIEISWTFIEYMGSYWGVYGSNNFLQKMFLFFWSYHTTFFWQTPYFLSPADSAIVTYLYDLLLKLFWFVSLC